MFHKQKPVLNVKKDMLDNCYQKNTVETLKDLLIKITVLKFYFVCEIRTISNFTRYLILKKITNYTFKTYYLFEIHFIGLIKLCI